ncbi:unnamed protein product [Cochlearia groenlandica]
MTDVILAGMSTSQRADSINTYLDKYVHKKTSLQEFVKLYGTILQDICEEEEAKADPNKSTGYGHITDDNQNEQGKDINVEKKSCRISRKRNSVALGRHCQLNDSLKRDVLHSQRNGSLNEMLFWLMTFLESASFIGGQVLVNRLRGDDVQHGIALSGTVSMLLSVFSGIGKNM